MREQRPKTPTLTNPSDPLDEVRQYLAACAGRVSDAANLTRAVAARLAQSTAAKTSHAPQTVAGALRATSRLARVRARQLAPHYRDALILFICACLILQPNAALAARSEANISPKPANSIPVNHSDDRPLTNLPNETANSRTPATSSVSPEAQPPVQSYFESLGELISVTAAEPLPPPPVDAAVSRKVPSLENGRVGGNLRVYAGQSFSFDGGFTVTDETYVVGTPTVTVATNATYHGSVDDGGESQPTGYTVAVNGTSRLVGKLHLRANALAFPADIPASVPAPAGTRIVNINTASDINNIGDWATLKELHVNKSGETVTVPPGTYGAFSVEGNSRLNFAAGVYNFSDGFTFASNASIKVTGQTTINVGSSANISNTSLMLGDNTLSGDVKLNVLGALCVITGNSTIKALVRVPNGIGQVAGASVVRGQVIADTLQILSNGNVDGDTASSGPAETTAPLVAITSPANNFNTTSATITVSGTASDPGTNASGIAQVTVNNVPASYNASNGTWTLANVPLAVGPNTITARATDNAGNQATPQTVTVNRPDTTGPTVTIASPANNFSTPNSSINITGSAADAGPNQSGVDHVTVNGQPASFNPQTGSWTFNNFPLAVGSSNPITAQATDHANNVSTTVTINVVRQPPADNTPPTLTISSPAEGSHTELATTTVTGSVADPGQFPSGVAQVTVNGVPATINADCSWTRANVPLSIGSNPIVVIAVDHAGNATQPQTRTVHRDDLADTQAPTITITSPANNFTSSQATITVSGTAVDSGANATGVRRVVVNGREAIYDPATHQWTISGVTLNEGSNSITAFAEDGATPPNRGDAAPINVTLHTPDTKAPAVTITSPLTSFETYATTVNLAGTAVDDGLNFTGVQSVTVNGTPAAYDAATGQWSVTAFPLAYGPNQIVVIARDGAPTPNQGQATVQITRLQVPPPSLELSTPQNGAVLAASSITVAGSVSTLAANPVTVTVNGQNAPVSGGQFAKTVTLTEGANTITVVATDALSQHSQSSLAVIRDLSPPAVSFANVPATVQPGNSYQILIDAVDNVGVADVEFRVNGQFVATSSTAPYQFTLSVPLAYAPGATLVLSAVARDLTNTAAVATAQTRTGGPGGISGYVFDDATGYVLPSVSVLLNSDAPATTDTLGVFNLVSTTANGVVRLTKDGYTPGERLYSVSQGEGTSLFDARLTPLDSHANVVGLSGGVATGDGGRVRLSFNPGTLGEQVDLRLTSVSPQGLANLLPYGWSPVPGAVIDARTTAGVPAFQAPAHLAISQVAGLSSATPLVLARYDEAAHRWMVVASNLAATNETGALSADLPTAGQYAFLVADTGVTAPPPATVGQPLTAAQAADSAALDSAQATAVATPRSAVFSGSARSSISFLATATSKLPSGVSIEATFGETYNLLGGRDAELVDRPAQDFVLYAYPAETSDQPNRLGAFFVAKPTRTDFSITEIFNANVHVEIRSGRQSRLGVLIDASGGAVRASDGSRLTIPANSVPSAQSVFFNNLSPQLANVSLPEGYEIVAAYDLEIGSAMLTNSATISVPGLTGDLSRIVVARVLTVGGQRSPKAVARAVADSSDSLISTTTAPTVPAGVALAGINTSGRYLFIRVPQAFGYAKGVVTDSASGGALGMVKVSGNQTPFIDVTGADGQFVVIGSAGADAAGANQIGAAALTTDATGHATASLAAQDAVANANLAVSAVPLQVESITPANGAQNMIATTPVTITFNKPIAASSITGSSLTLSTSTGNPVLGSITVLAGNRVAVFTPAATLAAATTYRVSLNHSVRDLYGHQLTTDFTSTFTTAATVTINNRLRPEQITISYPDANGLSTVSIPAGSVPEGSLILVVNNTSGSTLSTMAGTGALLLQIPARVGDELSLTITQPDGTQYRVTQAAYRRADGFVSVGSNGGTITSDDGKVLLSVPAGAISGQADLKLTSRAESDISIPRIGEMDPASVPFGAGVRITAGGNFVNDQELHLEVTAPAGATEGQRVAFMKPAKLTEANVERDVWEVLTSGKVEGGKFKTMSPPFLGITLGEVNGNLGIYDAYAFMPGNFRAVTGLITEHVNNGAPRPLANVVVTITGTTGSTSSQVVAKTAANGRFGTLDYAVASADSVQISATDTLGRTKTAGASPYQNINPITNPGLNGLRSMFAAIEFPSSDGLPETLPALLQMEGRMLELQTDQPDTLRSVGRVVVGSHVEIKTTATPDVKQITGQLLAGGTVVRQLVWTNTSPGSGVYVTDFEVTAEGSYSVAVTTHTQANVAATKATATFSFVALQDPNTRPSLSGPPRVLSVTPANGSQQVSSGSRIHLEFSEPVKNLVPGQTLYLTKLATGEHIGGELSSGGLPIGANQEHISSIDLQPAQSLEANKEYAVEVTTSVKDSEDHALDQEYTSPEDTSAQPFRSTFKTFHSFVLTETPPETDSYRIATAGELAITVTPGSGSFMHIWDIANPELPKFLANQFVPNYAIAFDIADAELDEDIIKVDSTHQQYRTIAVVISLSPQDTSHPINLWIYNLTDPERPSMIGVVSLAIPDSLPAYPSYVKIHHKRAYIGNTGRGGVDVVDLETAVNQLAQDNPNAWFRAVLRDGYGRENRKQKGTYGHSENESAPVFSVSVMDQNVPAANGAGANNSPVAYIASNKLQLFSFDFDKSHDNDTVFFDRDGDTFDDHLLASSNLSPAGFALDVRAVPRINLHGQATDLAVLLGADRLWIYDVTNPRDPHAYSSRSFSEMGLGPGYARRLEVEGTLAYVMFTDKVAVIDFSNPALPFVSSTISDIGTDLRWLAVQDGFVYTLDGVSGTPTAKMRVSIGGAASLVYVHGANADPLNVCANPVLVSRTDNHMLQPAETLFTVYGHDAPVNAKVIITKELGSGDRETLATIVPQLDPEAPPNIIKGRASWTSSVAIDRAAVYTAELIIDEGKPTEYRARRVEIPFSNLIDQYQPEWGIPANGGQGYLLYLLGGNANITFMVQDQNNAFRTIQLENGTSRAYGFHSEPIVRSTTGLNNLPAGRYLFRLIAATSDVAGVSEQVEGTLTIGEGRRDVRQPGGIVVGNVELESGSLGLSHVDIPEIKNRGLSLSFTRSYNSAGATGFNPLGYGWHHNYQVLLMHHSQGDPSNPNLPAGPFYEIIGGEGGGQTFAEGSVVTGVEAKARAPFQGTLRKNADDSFDFFTRAHVKYHFTQDIESNSASLFNLGYMGNLAYIEEPNGNKLTLNYDGQGRLFSVVDSSNRKLEFTYEQALTPFVGTVDSGNIAGQATNCTSRRFLRSLRQRFLQAELGRAWHITQVKGPGGIEINYDYDGEGNLERVSRSGGDEISQSTADSIWQYAYNPTAGPGANQNYSHLIRSVKPPNQPQSEDRLTRYEYQLDQPGQPIKTVIMPEQVSNSFSYTFTNGRITAATVTDGRNNQTSYQFINGEGNSKTVMVNAPRSAQSVIVFDNFGNRVSETDPEGMTTTHRYENGNAVETVMTGGGETVRTTATYENVFNKMTSFTDARQQITSYSIDPRTGNVTRVQLPTGRPIIYDYKGKGDLDRYVDEYGFVTTYESYDGYGNAETIRRETSDGGSVTKHQTFDQRSRLIASSDDLGATISNTYDALDHVIRQTVTDPSGYRDTLSSTMTYLPEGQLKTLIQSGSNQTLELANEYDALNRVVLTTETPSGAGPFVQPFRYDRNSNLEQETDRRGVTRTRTYDALNFVTSETLSGVHGASLTTTTALETDKLGNPVRVQNLYGEIVRLEYDGLHRLKVRNLPGDYKEQFAYDGNGQIVSSKDRNNRESLFTYDPVNRPKTMRDPAGRITNWTYDDATRTVTKELSPQGLTETTRADGLGRTLRREVKFGATTYATVHVYQGRKVTTTDPRGTVTERFLSAFNETGNLRVIDASPAYSESMHYAALGGMSSRTDALARQTSYALDGLGRATQINYPGSFTEQFVYDGEGLVSSHTDRRGVVSTMTYDNLRRPLTRKVLDGSTQIAVLTIQYDDAAHTETRTDAENHTTVSLFDGLNRISKLTNADNKFKTWAYDGMNLRSESDFKGISTEYEYDQVDRVQLVKDRKAQVTNILNVDNNGYQRTTTNRRGFATIETFDPLGRLTSVSQNGEPLASYRYDGNNNRVFAADGLGNPTIYSYDKLNRVISIDHAGQQNETFTYNAVGNVIAQGDGHGPVVSMEYDELNHLKKRTDGESNSTLYHYDGEGLLLDRTDPKGAAYKTSYDYNALRSLTQVKDAKNGIWEIAYDRVQNLKRVKDPLGRTVLYDYDSLNRLQQITQPQNLITRFGYDANNNRSSITDPKGQITTVAFDELDRPGSVAYTNTGGSKPLGFAYDYDPEGNLTGVSEKLTPTTTRNYSRSYDGRDRLKTATDPFNRTVSFIYDPANNLKSVKDADQKVTSYSYDPHNRLESVSMNDGATAAYTWFDDGLLQKVDYGSGLKREYNYDNADRLTEITNTVGTDSGVQTQQFVYGYDANSNRTTETRKQNGQTIRDLTYSYDLLDRLTDAAYATPGQRPANPPIGESVSYTEMLRATGFAYDPVGNRTSASAQDHTTTITLTTDENGATTETRQTVDAPLRATTALFDDLNRLTSSTTTGDAGGEITFAYDQNGNLTSTTRQSQVTARYEYDCRDQLRRVLNGSSQELAAFDYDFERHRLEKTVGGNTLRYVYAQDQVVGEYNSDNQLQNRYDLGAGEVVHAEFGGGEGARRYFSDALGSITALAQKDTTTSGSLTAAYEYDAWGNYFNSAGTSANTIGYTGQRMDGETGLMPLGNGERYYSPTAGSFIQQDSMAGRPEVPASLNRYAYAHGNPVNHTDPTGHFIFLPILIVALTAALIAINTGTGYYEAEARRMAAGKSEAEMGSSLALGFSDATGMTQAFRGWTGTDAYTGRDVHGFERVTDVVMGTVAVVGTATLAGQAGSAMSAMRGGGKAAAQVMSEGRALAQTERQMLSTTAKGINAERGALSVADETSNLRVGASKAEQAATDALEATSRTGRQVEDFMEAARGRMNETRARYGFTEASDGIVGMADDAANAGDEFVEFYHGTSKASAANIRSSGVDVTRGRVRTDFGQGFYTTTDRAQAMSLAEQFADGGAVVSFRVPKSELGSLRGLSFDQPTASWARFVRHNRLAGRLHGYDIVDGPMLGNPRQFLQGAPPTAWGQQTSWHTQKAADVLMRGIQ